MDDTSLLEYVPASSSVSHMQTYLDETLHWLHENDMIINTKKTKEMIFNFKKSPLKLGHLTIKNTAIECVDSFKLLGVTIQSDMKWNIHIETITKRASKQLFFLKQLQRSGLSQRDLPLFYVMKISP